jgi:two-component system, NtrC family, sensor kinase
MKRPRHLVFPLLFSLILFLYPLSIKAQDTLVYTADQTLTDVGQYVYFYKDETNALSVEQIKNLPDAAFQKSTSTNLRFGITTASIWLKLAVKNQTASPLFLAFQSNVLNSLNAFIYDEGGKLTEKDAFADKELQRSNIVLNIGTSPKFLYVKIKSHFSLQLPLVLSRLEPLNHHYYKLDVKNGLCIGILIAMALYNLFIFFLVKDRLYLYYCLYILTTLWTIGHLTGLGLLIWGGHPIITRFVGVPFVLLSAWLFTIRFLNLDKNMPRTYTAIKVLCVLIACIIPIDFLNLQFIRGAAQQTLAPISTISMLVMGILSHFQGNKSAKYYVFAWVFFLVGSIITSFSYSGILPFNYFTSNASLFGACIESILLAFALANRINTYRAESEEAQALAFQRLEENERLAREQNKSLEENDRLVREQNKVLEEKVHERTTELETSLETLKATQNQLIQSEKLANLGELTAGISHEIQNPLNFVTNFSELSVDLVKDLKDELAKPTIDKAYIDELFADLAANQEKIKHHGRRASSIVKGMLEHSRASTGIREHIDINQLADEYLRLSYHGLRAKDKTFNAEFKTDFADSLPKIAVIPQDLGRVLLNLINNAFYAVNERQKDLTTFQKLSNLETYTPSVIVSTQQVDNQIIIKVKDNGTGMPESVKTKIFQPFFSTKPTGEGTGLGLSLAYDIVTKGHGGTLVVESTEGIGTTFTLTLSI